MEVGWDSNFANYTLLLFSAQDKGWVWNFSYHGYRRQCWNQRLESDPFFWTPRLGPGEVNHSFERNKWTQRQAVSEIYSSFRGRVGSLRFLKSYWNRTVRSPRDLFQFAVPYHATPISHCGETIIPKENILSSLRSLCSFAISNVCIQSVCNWSVCVNIWPVIILK